MNEALLVSAVRQHELTEAAEALNAKLQAEIKERKQVQEPLLLSEMLANAGRMAASIAHEINNPLDAVINTLFLVRTSADLPESAREYLEIADAEQMRIGYITRQTLGFIGVFCGYEQLGLSLDDLGRRSATGEDQVQRSHG
jgi:two-component system, NtrC family, sensor kinase